MKFKKFNMKVGTAFDPDKDFTADVAIILKKHPTKPNEGATKEYVDKKVEEFYKEGLGENVITNTKVLPIKGPDLNYSTNRELTLKDVPNKMSGKKCIIASVDKNGRVVGFREVSNNDIDYSKKISFEIVTKLPDSLEGWKITGLASSKKRETILGKAVVTNPPKTNKSILPKKYLNTIWDDSGYEMRIGDVVMKYGSVDGSVWLRANGAKITKEHSPELVAHLTGNSNATEAYLPDCTIRDNYLLNSFGIQAISYIRAKLVSDGEVIPIPEDDGELPEEEKPNWDGPTVGDKPGSIKGNIKFSRISDKEWELKGTKDTPIFNIANVGDEVSLLMNLYSLEKKGTEHNNGWGGRDNDRLIDPATSNSYEYVDYLSPNKDFSSIFKVLNKDFWIRLGVGYFFQTFSELSKTVTLIPETRLNDPMNFIWRSDIPGVVYSNEYLTANLVNRTYLIGKVVKVDDYGIVLTDIRYHEYETRFPGKLEIHIKQTMDAVIGYDNIYDVLELVKK